VYNLICKKYSCRDIVNGVTEMIVTLSDNQ